MSILFVPLQITPSREERVFVSQELEISLAPKSLELDVSIEKNLIELDLTISCETY